MNRVVLMGHLAADPDLRETTTGKKLANFSVATNRMWKDRDGKQNRQTDYHRVTAWNKLGEVCGQHLAKGSSVYIEGRLQNKSYETKDGEKKYLTEVVARDVNILTWKKNAKGEPDAAIEPIVEEEEEIDDEG